jgi:hypothetical protein
VRSAGRRSLAAVLGAMALIVLAGALGAQVAVPSPSPSPVSRPTDTCLECHEAQSNRALSRQVFEMAGDAHARAGISCDSCHGGDKTTGMDDPTESMDPKKGYIGIPKPSQIAAMCGKCHADPLLMRNFAPQLPTDQVSKLAASKHGQAAAKDVKGAASCSSCHRAHGVHPAADPRSSVHASNVPTTCARCHGDQSLMEPFNLATDQLQEFKASVHWRAVRERGDRTAPVCHDCHGNHAAGVPAPAAVSQICGRCHTAELETFSRGKHTKIEGFRGCAECHANHRVLAATDDILSPSGLCYRCHDKPGGARDQAKELHAAYRGLAAEATELETAMVPLAKLGVALSTCEAELRYAREKLLEGRRLVHADTLDDVKVAIGAGRAAIFRGRVALGLAHDSVRWRRWGALAFGVLALLTALTLAARARMAYAERAQGAAVASGEAPPSE